MNQKSVLISGASIAGPALALWLHRYGFRVTLVERAPALRDGGHAIDFRGAGVDVLKRMGLFEAVREHDTGMRGITVVDGAGETLAELPSEVMSGELEVLRGDLTHVLYEATRRDAEYVFGDSIVSMVQGADGVRVEFEKGEPRTFDLVVGADGAHSNVRRLVFGPESEYAHDLGLRGAIFSAPNYLGLDHRGVLCRLGDKAGMFFSARHNTEARAGLFCADRTLECDRHDTAAQKRFIAERFAGEGWEIPRLLDIMETTDDFFFDTLTQIRMDTWSRGRVVLLGDAAYCAAPTSGMGTSQAMVGAYVLAGELATAAGDHETAFTAFEKEMRDYVAQNQLLGRRAAASFFPSGGEGGESGGHSEAGEGPAANGVPEAPRSTMELKEYQV
ncbi:FAD-dependent monooxygenase [Streptomyces varsoviensis]|uniref:FAD-dependent monooxygenase n=1 Tax=Streptomyces varsoviensis TaxID=67373 RepID=UPI0007C58558|nr:FAD-dependent monooxygenase [Streptomyces varsoviensis]